MRNAAQLRAAALDTGTFLNYRGDGASVPWLEFGLIARQFAAPLWLYKQYLDLNWPETWKLHDWAYTPYGALINCTREEADGAVYEEVSRTSPIDGWITWSAVRVGGAPWFGHSMTGYSGMQIGAGVDNMFRRYLDP